MNFESKQMEAEYIYCISTVKNNPMITADTFEETMIFVGRLLERWANTIHVGKIIYVEQRIRREDGNYIQQDGLFEKEYLVE